MRVKIRDEGLVRNKAVYLALGVQADGTKDILDTRTARLKAEPTSGHGPVCYAGNAKPLQKITFFEPSCLPTATTSVMKISSLHRESNVLMCQN